MGAQATVATAPAPELLARLYGILAQVADPEIPVLSVLDLGIIRHLAVRPGGQLEVGIAPTYSGCPANAVIKADVLRALRAAGFDAAAVDVLAPPWSERLAERSGPPQARGVRHCAAGGARGPVGRRAGCMPAVPARSGL